MSDTLVVSSRGQITLPAAMRRHLGIKPGGVVIVEERDGELTLKPAVVLEVEQYSDEQIAAWNAQDELSDSERERILSRLKSG